MRWWRAIKLLLFMNCRHAAPLISHSMDRSLPAEERAAVAVHLMGCNHCRRYRRQLVLLRDVLYSIAAAPIETKLPLDARARMQVAIERDHRA